MYFKLRKSFEQKFYSHCSGNYDGTKEFEALARNSTEIKGELIDRHSDRTRETSTKKFSCTFTKLLVVLTTMLIYKAFSHQSMKNLMV